MKVANGLRPTTERSYRAHIDKHLVPHLGRRRLRELKTADVTRMLQTIAKPGERRAMGPASIRRVHATLRSALGDAKRQGLVRTNVAVDAMLPTASRPKVRPWEADELGAFLDHAAADRLGSLFELVALAGLRRGEACGLRRSDVDIARGYLVVRQQLVQVDGRSAACPTCGGGHKGIVFGMPKTSSGDARRIRLGERGVGALLAQRLSQDVDRAEWGRAYSDHDLVFARPDGNPLAPDQVSKSFVELATAAGLRRVRLHDLRHGSASLMIAAGVDIAVVSKMLGHSSISITADTYSHLLEGVDRRAADAVEALLPPRREQSVSSGGPETTMRPRREDEAAGQGGAPSGTRTPNPLIKSQLLCQLS
jgi:integrase